MSNDSFHSIQHCCFFLWSEVCSPLSHKSFLLKQRIKKKSHHRDRSLFLQDLLDRLYNQALFVLLPAHNSEHLHFQGKKPLKNTNFLDSEIQVFQLLTLKPMKQHKDQGEVVLLPPSHFISWLENFTLKAVAAAGEVVPVSQNPSGAFCLQRDKRQTQLNVGSFPVKSLAVSHLPR